MNENKTTKLISVALITAAMAIVSQLSIPLPSGIPITLQTLAVAFAGYLLGAKYGTNYQEILKKSEHYITDRVIHLQNEKMLIYSKNGILKLLDTDTSVIWQGTLSYRNFNASDFIIYKSSLWACFPDCNVILRYNLSTMRAFIYNKIRSV